MTPAHDVPSITAPINVKSRIVRVSAAATAEGSERRRRDTEQGIGLARCSRGKWRNYGLVLPGLGTDISPLQIQHRGREPTVGRGTQINMTLTGSKKVEGMEADGQRQDKAEVAEAMGAWRGVREAPEEVF